MSRTQVTTAKGHRTHSAVTPGTTPTLLAAANPNRKSLTLQNQGNVTVFIGPARVRERGEPWLCLVRGHVVQRPHQ